MILFNRKPAFCTICNKQITHKHKPKKEWGVNAPLCGDCYVDMMKQSYDESIKQSCVTCGVKKKISDLWEPRWQWDMKGLLCKNCFHKKEDVFNKKQKFCSICGATLGFIRYNPKSKWNIEGQLCKNCWNTEREKIKEKMKFLKKFECDECDKKFSQQEMLMQHQQIAHCTDSYDCKVCNQFFSSMEKMRLHLQRNHSYEKQN